MKQVRLVPSSRYIFLLFEPFPVLGQLKNVKRLKNLPHTFVITFSVAVSYSSSLISVFLKRLNFLCHWGCTTAFQQVTNNGLYESCWNHCTLLRQKKRPSWARPKMAAWVENLSPAMGRGIDSRNRVWYWIAKLYRQRAGTTTWFLAPIAGLKLPTLDKYLRWLEWPPGCDSSCLGTRGCRTGSTFDLWSAWRTRSPWSWDGPPGPAAGSPASGPGTPLGGGGGMSRPPINQLKGQCHEFFCFWFTLGPGGKLIHEKTRSKKSRDCPLSQFSSGFSRWNNYFVYKFSFLFVPLPLNLYWIPQGIFFKTWINLTKIDPYVNPVFVIR